MNRPEGIKFPNPNDNHSLDFSLQNIDLSRSITDIPIIRAANNLKNTIDTTEERAVIAEEKVVILEEEIKKAKERADKAEEKVIFLEEEIKKAKERADKAEEQSYIDSLTGCKNKNYYEDLVNKFDHERGDQVCLVVCDINNFKQINDIYGHDYGDKYLKKTADFLITSFRKGDTIIRYGGDEFVIFLSNFKNLNEKDFLKMVKAKFTPKILKANGIDIAYGASLDNGSENIEEIFKRADSAMYNHKSSHKSKLNNYSFASRPSNS